MQAPFRARSQRLLALGACAALSGLGCESLVGIHPSRDLESAGGAPSTAGSDTPGAPEGPDDEASPAPDGMLGGGSETALPGNGPIGLDPPDGDPDPGLPGGTTGENDTGAPSADAGTPSEPGDTVGPDEPGEPDKPGEPDDPGDESGICVPPEPPPGLVGTAFLFTAGPNSGSADATGLCSFPNAALPTAPRFYGAIERSLMASPAAACGACLRVTQGPDSVDITVIDVIESNPLAAGFTLAMDGGARSALSGADTNLDVRFSFVPCEEAGTIRARFVSESDPSVQLLGHRNPVVAVRLETPNGNRVDLTRQEYNYWTPPSGFSSRGPRVSLILTDDVGNELVLPDLRVSDDIVDTGLQFPVPANECLTP